MSGTISLVRDRVGSAVAVSGIVLLAAGVAAAIIVRVGVALRAARRRAH